MSGLRFEVGDMAIYAIPTVAGANKWVGEVVEIVEVGPFAPNHRHAYNGKLASLKRHDYLCKHYTSLGGVWDWQLRKIDLPDEPASLTRESECEVQE
jgi:hypothetical protein